VILDDSDFGTLICNNFVALSCRCLVPDEKGSQVEKCSVFSGFLIETLGQWCLVTAGHVLEEINAVVAHPQGKLNCALGDFFGTGPKIRRPTPFAYDSDMASHVDKNGVDIGFIFLRDFYCMSLRANEITPIPVALWHGNQMPQCDEYWLLGMPISRQVQLPRTESRGPGVSAELSVVRLKPEQPEIHPDSESPMFIADAQDGDMLPDVKGMSGGPIIGVRTKADGNREYACVAVQAKQRDQSHKVVGTPTDIILRACNAWIAQLI
jgi:hypothetical protein